MNSIRVKPEEARARILAALRAHDYKGRTSELAEWTGMQTSVVRRAALFLASKNQLVSVLLPGRGKGEYLFHLSQLVLFEDHKPPATMWQKVKGWFR